MRERVRFSQRRTIVAILIAMSVFFLCAFVLCASFRFAYGETGSCGWIVSHGGTMETITEDGVQVLKITPAETNAHYGSAIYETGVPPVDITIDLRIYFLENVDENGNPAQVDNWVSVNFTNEQEGGRGSESAIGPMLLFRKELGNDGLVCHLYENKGVVVKKVNVQPKMIQHGESYTDVQVSLRQTDDGYTLFIEGERIGDYMKTYWGDGSFIAANKLTYVGVGMHGGACVGIRSFSFEREMLDPTNWSNSAALMRTETGGYRITAGTNTLFVPQDARYVRADFNRLTLTNGASLTLKLKDAKENENKSVAFTLKDTVGMLTVEYHGTPYETRFSSEDIQSFAIRYYDEELRVEINGKKAFTLTLSPETYSTQDGQTYFEITNAATMELVSLTSGEGTIVYELGFDPKSYMNAESTIELDENEDLYVISDTSLTERLETRNTMVKLIPQGVAEGKSFRVGFSKSSKTVTDGFENGMLLEFRKERDGFVVSFLYYGSSSEDIVTAFSGYFITPAVDGSIEIRFVYRQYGGYAVFLNGERVVNGTDDVFGFVEKNTVSYAMRYSYLSYFVSDGIKLKLTDMQTAYFSDPITCLPQAGCVEDAIGLDINDWVNHGGHIVLNEDGSLRMFSSGNITHNTFTEKIDSEYVKFTLYIQNFTDMLMLDSYITFSLVEQADDVDTNSVPTITGANGILFRLRNIVGSLHIDAFKRQDGKLLQLVTEQKIADVANGYVVFESFYVNNEFSLSINGEKLLDENGFNPLFSVTQDVFTDIDGYTYFAISGWNEIKGEGYPSGVEVVDFSFCGIENQLPDAYVSDVDDVPTSDYRLEGNYEYVIEKIDGDFHITVVEKEKSLSESENKAWQLWVPLACAIASSAVILIVALVHSKNRRGN